MDFQKWQQIKTIFSEAVELTAGFKRERFLELQGAAVEKEIIDAVRRMIAADEKPELLTPIADVSNLWSEDDDKLSEEDFAGKKIGNYHILREVGRGGMGIVYEARREGEDFSQTVALKILRRGMDSTELVSRFRRERQILANLEHANIARMLDGGRSENGTPFLTMEFVKGTPIDEFCDEKDLNLEQRLRLFLQICEAVSFAHSRLVVHRDLKPSNILVTYDAVVKLLDFGISKIITDEENALLNQTLTQFAVMTPQYASPEQIKGETLTTASDIYTLGLILYELLTGAKTYVFPTQRADEIAKIISEVEPTRPSSIVSSKSQSQSFKSLNATNDTGQNRTNSKLKTQNSKLLKGDLDNIILKSLRKEPARRYASVEQFASDIKRHLDGLPVIARPDTISYRLEKFVKRNRIPVIAGLLFFLTLTGGIAATTWQAVRAKRQQELAERQRLSAEQRFNQVRELANNIVFKYYAEAEKLPGSAPIRQMFVDDSLAYFNSLAQDAGADDALKSELARTFLQIGKVQGLPTSPNLGMTAGAIENYRKGIELLEPLAEKSADTSLQGDLVKAYAEYAVILRQNGNNEESEKAFQKAFARAEQFLSASPHDENLFTKITPAYLFAGDTLPIGTSANDNISIYNKIIEMSEKFLASHPEHLKANNFLAAAYDRKGRSLLALALSAREMKDFEDEESRLEEARKSFESGIEISEKLIRLYPDNIIAPALFASANVSQAAYFIETEDYERALQNLQKSFDFYNPLLEKDDAHIGLKTYVADIEKWFGSAYFRTGQIEKAEKHFARAFELMDKAVQTDPNNFDLAKQRAEIKFSYADEFLSQKATKKARQLYEKAFTELYEAAKVRDAEYAESLRANYFEKLGDCFLAEKFERYAAGEYRKALEIWQKNTVHNLSGIVQNNKLLILEMKIKNLRK